MSIVTTEKRRTYRSSVVVPVSLVAGIAATAGWAAGAVEIARAPTLATSRSVGVAIMVALALVSAWFFLWRCARVRVVTGPEGVVVRNVWRTHRFDWPEIERFDLGPGAMQDRTGRVHLADGRTVATFAVSGRPPWWSNDPADALIAALNAEVDARRTTTAGDGLDGVSDASGCPRPG